MKQRKNLKIVLIIIGVILIGSVVYSIYNINKITKGYEKTDAICKWENKIVNNDGTDSYYQREYTYIVSGEEYTIDCFEAKRKPYKIIKYNPNNPNEARTYEGINIEDIVIFCIGVILICSSFILNIENSNEKLNEIKYKFLRMSKRNIIKFITVCFWGYMTLSLIFTLKEVFFAPDWNQIVMQYSQAEIIIECIIFIVGRCSFRKSTYYFNIFRT